MSERKVLSKYYPPDFDPITISRRRGPKVVGPKTTTVRLMAPWAMQCTSCGHFIGRGTKFNARKESPPGEQYLGIQIHRFYIRCTRCSSEICFRTDPANNDYAVLRGAQRSTEPWRQRLKRTVVNERGEEVEEDVDETVEQRLDRMEREEAEAAGDEEAAATGRDKDAMLELEAKTEEARREMAVADALDAIRLRNAARERAVGKGEADEADDVVAQAKATVEELQKKLREEQDRQDTEAARRAFSKALVADYGSDDDEEMDDPTTVPNKAVANKAAPIATTSTAFDTPAEPAATFRRAPKTKKKNYSAALGIKKKA